MELFALLSSHRDAIGAFAAAQSPEAIEWAEARIDYFAERICELRQNAAETPFDFRDRAPAR